MPIKFSLTRRDGDLNRLLPSEGNIPNTHLANPAKGSHRSPLVQLRNHGLDQRRTLRDIMPPGRSRPLGTRP
jgi:hypothetical protein